MVDAESRRNQPICAKGMQLITAEGGHHVIACFTKWHNSCGLLSLVSNVREIVYNNSKINHIKTHK